jgi:hypothetical protein
VGATDRDHVIRRRKGPPEPPHVVVLGGYLTEPWMYRRLGQRLLARGAGSVSVAPVHVVDWMAAGFAGLGPLLLRSGLAIRRAHRHAGGGPLIVVGHSGGGILARLAMAPVPFDERHAGVSDAVGCLVTLGTPHGLARAPVVVRHPGVTAAAFLDRVTPGAWWAPTTTYLTVASTAVGAAAWNAASRGERLLGAPYRAVVGPIGPHGGDGIVGADLAHLAGALQVTYDDVLHGTVGTPWYGDAAIVDRWWPQAIAQWRLALEARSAVGGDRVGDDRVGDDRVGGDCPPR